MGIVEELGINLDKSELIALVGAGGKTTTMFEIAEELKFLGKRVLVTTTTAIYYPKPSQFDKIALGDKYVFNMFNNTDTAFINVLGSLVNGEGKLVGIHKEEVDNIFEKGYFDYILVESDGSKGRSIKAPGAHEPVIPELTTRVIGIIGMDALGKEINEENVHRTEIFCNITNSKAGDIIDSQKVLALIENYNGLFKGTPRSAIKYLRLNKVELDKNLLDIEFIKMEIIKRKIYLENILLGCKKLL